MTTQIIDINRTTWARGNFVHEYARRGLKPVEVILLATYGEHFRGRVLELGCGAGRMLGYVAALAEEALAIDISPAMVEYCRAHFPAAHVDVGDISAPDSLPEGAFDVILGIDNVFDVLDHDLRQGLLRALREKLRPGGLLIFSSHNREVSHEAATRSAAADRASGGLLAALGEVPPKRVLEYLEGAPRRLRNRRRLAASQFEADDYSVRNDSGQDYALLHYYIGRDAQERQLTECGLELLECRDESGAVVGRGEPSAELWLHYVARVAHTA